MIEDLGWEKLEARRQQLKAAMLYRIINHLVYIQATSLLIPAGTHTRGHANRFLAPFGSVNTFKYSFYPSSIRLWNSLRAEVISALSLDGFKTRIGTALP